jgi:hypothetical protein
MKTVNTIDRINAYAERKHMDEDERQDLLREIAMEIADRYFYTEVWTWSGGLEGFETWSDALEWTIKEHGGAEQFIQDAFDGKFFVAKFEGELKDAFKYSDGTVREEAVATVSIKELRFSEDDKKLPDICDIWGEEEDRDEMYGRLYETIKLTCFEPIDGADLLDIFKRYLAPSFEADPKDADEVYSIFEYTTPENEEEYHGTFSPVCGVGYTFYDYATDYLPNSAHAEVEFNEDDASYTWRSYDGTEEWTFKLLRVYTCPAKAAEALGYKPTYSFDGAPEGFKQIFDFDPATGEAR